MWKFESNIAIYRDKLLNSHRDSVEIHEIPTDVYKSCLENMQQNTLMLAMCLNVSVIDCCLTHHQVWTLKRIFVGKIGMFLSSSHQISPRWPCSLTFQACRSQGGKGERLPPIFWHITYPYSNQGGKVYPPTYYSPPIPIFS